MKHAELFKIYQESLKQIERQRKEGLSSPERIKKLKREAFFLYEDKRYKCEDGIGAPTSVAHPNKRIPPYEKDGQSFPCLGVIEYRGEVLPVYYDDAGMSDFIVYQGRDIMHDSFGGETDWYYEVDRIKDKIDD